VLVHRNSDDDIRQLDSPGLGVMSQCDVDTGSQCPLDERRRPETGVPSSTVNRNIATQLVSTIRYKTTERIFSGSTENHLSFSFHKMKILGYPEFRAAFFFKSSRRQSAQLA